MFEHLTELWAQIGGDPYSVVLIKIRDYLGDRHLKKLSCSPKNLGDGQTAV
jgi:hypothetical protein